MTAPPLGLLLDHVDPGPVLGPASIFEIVVASLLALLGLRSLVRWLSTRFEAVSVSELLLYALHVTARVAVWFSLAAAFLGYALIDEPQRYQWFVFVPLFLAAIQLVTGLLLARQPSGGEGAGAEDGE